MNNRQQQIEKNSKNTLTFLLPISTRRNCFKCWEQISLIEKFNSSSENFKLTINAFFYEKEKKVVKQNDLYYKLSEKSLAFSFHESTNFPSDASFLEKATAASFIEKASDICLQLRRQISDQTLF